MLFYHHIAIFYQIALLLFFIKNRCFVLHSVWFSKIISLTSFNNFSKTKSEKRETKCYFENIWHQFPDLYNQIPDEFQVQKQPVKVRNIQRKTFVLESLFNKFIGPRLATVLKRDYNTGVFLWKLQTLRTPILKKICERLVLIVVIYCIENWIKLFRKRIGLPDWPFVSFET